MSWDFSVYFSWRELDKAHLDKVYASLISTYGGDHLEDDEGDEGDDGGGGGITYVFDGFRLHFLEEENGCLLRVHSEDIEEDMEDGARECINAWTDALGGEVTEEEWLAQAPPAKKKTKKKKKRATEPKTTAKREGKGPPTTARLVAYDVDGKECARTFIPSDRVYAHDKPPASRLQTEEGRAKLGVARLEIYEYDGSRGELTRWITEHFDASGRWLRTVTVESKY